MIQIALRGNKSALY